MDQLECIDEFEASFSYQVDVICPNLDTSFTDIKQYFQSHHVYFLVSQIKLSQVLSDEFLKTFLEDGECYLYSFGTRLDCHDCVCLLPNGKLVLSVTKSTYERIPIEKTCETIKSDGLDKYEINLNVKTAKSTLGPEKFDVLKKAFNRMDSFSFYCYWKPRNEEKPDPDQIEEVLRNHFGKEHVHRCLNRVEAQFVDNRLDGMLKKFQNAGDCTIENWVLLDKCLGSLVNQIKIEDLIEPGVLEEFSDGQTKAKLTTASILRIKGFIPNSRILKPILEKLKSTYESLLDENESRQAFVVVHGFVDSPVGLCAMPNRPQGSRARMNHENFLNIIFQAANSSKSFTFSRHAVVAKDFDDLVLIH